MAFTRKYLKELGIDSDKIDLIIEAHAEVVDGIKEERDNLKARAGDVEALNTKIAELEKQALSVSEWKEKYDALNNDFEAYKTEQATKETVANKTNAYRDLLKGLGIADKRIDAIMRLTDVNMLELEDGKLKDAEALTESAKTEWAEFIPNIEHHGAGTETPPRNDGGGLDLDKLSIEEYISARNK